MSGFPSLSCRNGKGKNTPLFIIQYVMTMKHKAWITVVVINNG